MARTPKEILHSQNPHVVLLPTPGMGHLIPLPEFANKLIHNHRFSVTLIHPTDGPISDSQKKIINSHPSNLNCILLPAVNLDDLSEDAKIETRISLTITRSLPSFREIFKSITETEKVIALVVDLFGTDAFEVANEFNVPSFIFYPTTAMCLSFFLSLPELDAATYQASCEYRDLEERIKIPGCIPIEPEELLDPVQDRKNDAYKWLLHHTKRYKMAEGIVVNSFEDLEPGAIKALHEEEPGKPLIYPIGPLIHTDRSNNDEGIECLTWLDEQPYNSVLYISFGSGGTLSHEQLIELAMGLEMSEQRFLWVIRCPNDTISNATYFNVQSSSNNNNNNNPLDFLPKGFLERTKGKGLVVPNWAPQTRILSHGSIGGFLTHCGWNSTLESVVYGVPLIAWPLYAEQRMNAVMLTEDVRVALRAKTNSNKSGFIGRQEIAEIVKGILMEGENAKGLRSRMRYLKDAAAKALGEDGSSTKALAELASKMSKVLQN